MTIETNKALIRDLVREVWNEGRASAIDRYFAPELRSEIARHHGELLSAFSDLAVEIEELVAEGERVAARLLVSGVHGRGPFAGRPPSGKRLAWVSHRFYRIRDGRVEETRAMQDRLGLLRQLGALPETGPDVEWADGAPPEAGR